MNFKKFVEVNDLGIILNNKCFRDLTTMKVGGRIRTLYYPNSLESLIKAINYLEAKKKKYFIIGNGSNIIASDRVYKTIVISGKHLSKEITYEKDFFEVSAFYDLRKLIANLVKHEIVTLVDLAGIPATIGGALYMNAGANKASISTNLISVKYLEDGIIKEKTRDELIFGYRFSEFQNQKVIIISAKFLVIKHADALLMYTEIREKRKLKQPLEFPNSGSIFRNGKNYLAYQIIKRINLVGYHYGKASFSPKHANFIINLGKAKARDVYGLIYLAKKRALIYEDVNLEEEVILLNFSHYKFLRFF